MFNNVTGLTLFEGYSPGSISTPMSSNTNSLGDNFCVAENSTVLKLARSGNAGFALT